MDSEDDGAQLSPPTSPSRQNFSPPTSPLPLNISPPTSPLLSNNSPTKTNSSGSSSPSTPRKIRRRSHSKLSKSTLLRRQQVIANEESSDEETDAINSVQNVISRQSPSCSASDVQQEDNTHFESHSSGSSDESSDGSSSGGELYLSACSSSEAGLNSSSEDERSEDSAEDSADSDSEDPLYVGAEVSADEAILKVLQTYITERWTKTSLDSVVKLIKGLLPKPNLFPSSGHKLLSKLTELSAYQVINEHFYCSKCQSKKEKQTDVCENCINCVDCANMDETVKQNCECQQTGVFFEFSVEEQLRYMFECRGLASAIDQYHTHRESKPEGISDITDGNEYVDVKSKLPGKYDVVLMTSSDGVELSSSSKQEMWPILSVPCEVLPNRRSQFMLVSGVYVDKIKPKVNVFFKPFVDSLKKIYNNGGISWTHPVSKRSMNSQVVSPVVCADAPAKAIILNVKNHNHRFGCNFCEQKAVRVEVPSDENSAQPKRNRKQNKVKQKVTLRRFVYNDQEASLRTGERMSQQAQLAELRKKSRKGVIGHSIVSELPHFNPATSLCAEYLHVVLLGVVKYFLNIMCNVRGPWFIGNSIRSIDQFIKTIKVPDFIKRLPRGLRDVKYFKGSELRSYLLFYSLPALQPYLPNQYFQHWMLLVEGIYLLLKESVTENDLEAANVMLRCFVRDIGVLYHNRFYTYNVHNLLHLCDLVKRWGNLWATSAFPFESFNGFITSHVHGTKHLGKELLNNIRIIQSTKIFEMSMQVKRNISRKDVEICSSKLHFDLSDRETGVLHAKGMFSFDIFDRVKVRSEVFTSKYYDKNVKRANSIVQFKHQDTDILYGEILHFIQNSEEFFALINRFKVKHTDIFYFEESLYQIKHLIPVENSGELLVISVNCLVTKVIKAGKYLCIRPNPYEINL